LARAFSSRYDSSCPAKVTAVPPGVRATCALEALDQRRRGDGRTAEILAEEFAPLGGSEDLQAVQGRVGVGGGRAEQALEAPGHRRHGGAFKEVGAPLEGAAEPARLAPSPKTSLRVSVRSNFAASRSVDTGRDIEAGERMAAGGSILQGRTSPGTADGAPWSVRDRRPRRPARRHVLVRVGREADAPRPPHELAEAGIAREVVAQHEGVHEEADEILHGAFASARDGDADGHVVPAPRRPRRAARAASITMKRLAPHSAANRRRAECKSAPILDLDFGAPVD
jgi:hypothetical protein